MWSIRSISDASVGIPWMGLGAGKAAFILVMEVSVMVVMVLKGSVEFVF